MFALLVVCIAHTGRAADSAVVLQYHHVGDSTPAITSVTPDRFREHLDILEQGGYHVISLAQLMQALAERTPLPDKAVVITFDDAYLNIFDNAWPMLRQRNIPFTVFVNSEPVDRGYGSHMSWEQLRELSKAGVTLANHTHTHAHLPRKQTGESDADWRERIREEIELAEQRIQQETRQSHRVLAYPYGEYNNAVKDIVKNLGYRAFGQQSGPVGYNSDPLALPRFPVSADYGTAAAFRERLRTLPMPLANVKRPDNPLPHGSRPPLSLQLQAGDWATRQLRCYASGQGAIPVQWQNDTTLATRADRPLPAGRSRYNCTMPSGDGRFYWHSEPWVTLTQDSDWVGD